MSRYTYLACDLLTNAVLAELPLTGVSFTNLLNGAGDFTGTLQLSDSRVQKIDPITATEPSRVALYVDRDGVLLWGGIIWARKYAGTSQQLTITANEFWSYFRRRRIIAGASYSDTDQLSIASGLLNTAQSAASGNIGVQVNPAGVTSSVMRDFLVYGYEYKPVAEAIEEFSTLEGGFDFAIDVSYDSNGAPQKAWNPGYPRRGRNATQTGHVFDYPGNITDWEWDEDGTVQATSLYIVGEGEGDVMATSNVQAPDMLQAGYPLLEDEISYKDSADQNVLAARARAELEASKAAISVPTMTVRADADPVLGAYIVGDDARFVIDAPRFPGGLDIYKRITAIKVTPPESSTAESVTLTIGEAI